MKPRSSAVFRICGEILWCDHLNEGTLTWYRFLFYNSRVSWNEIWDFSWIFIFGTLACYKHWSYIYLKILERLGVVATMYYHLPNLTETFQTFNVTWHWVCCRIPMMWKCRTIQKKPLPQYFWNVLTFLSLWVKFWGVTTEIYNNSLSHNDFPIVLHIKYGSSNFCNFWVSRLLMYDVNIQIKPIQQYFRLVLFSLFIICLYPVDVTIQKLGSQYLKITCYYLSTWSL